MKKIDFWLVSLAGFFAFEMTAQRFVFQRAFGGGSGYDDARGIVATDDGGFVFTGLDQSGSDAAGSLFLTKINAAGAVVWRAEHDREAEDGGNFLLKMRDGSLLAVGHTALSYGVACDGLAVKFDENGLETAQTLFGGPFDDVGNQAFEAADGSIFIAGRSEKAFGKGFDFGFTKLSADLRTIHFQNQIGTDGDDIPTAIVELPDGSILIGGGSKMNSNGLENRSLMRFSASGDLLFQSIETKTGGPSERIFDLLALDGGDFLKLSSTLENDQIGTATVARCRLDGSVVWEKSLVGAGLAFGQKLTRLADGSFILAGRTQADETGPSFPFVAQFDENGAILWQKTYENWPDGRAATVCATADGGFCLAGKTKPTGAETDILIISDAPPSASALASRDIETLDFALFPNPATESIYIKFAAGGFSKTLVLADAAGRELLRQPFEGHETVVSLRFLASGPCYFQILDEKGAILKADQFLKN